jgi:hypothetical protein
VRLDRVALLGAPDDDHSRREERVEPLEELEEPLLSECGAA